MMADLKAFLADHGPAVVAEVVEAQGSTPREVGAFMLISESATEGTIGGGHLEFASIERARAMLHEQKTSDRLEFTLGPESGQCCGGRVRIHLAIADAAVARDLEARMEAGRQAYPDVFLFGAGHVGRALTAALTPLPLHVVVVETRGKELRGLPEHIETRLVAIAEAEIAAVRPGGAVVILTHDHGLDFLIGQEALKRDDLAYVGMIGSKTKRGVFRHHLIREGFDPRILDRLVLPIGGGLVRDKRPEVIAALVTAELLNAISTFSNVDEKSRASGKP